MQRTTEPPLDKVIIEANVEKTTSLCIIFQVFSNDSIFQSCIQEEEEDMIQATFIKGM
jgi:pyruvate/2-oxoglutarate/acetoin dehydrogenase E1 component